MRLGREGNYLFSEGGDEGKTGPIRWVAKPSGPTGPSGPCHLEASTESNYKGVYWRKCPEQAHRGSFWHGSTGLYSGYSATTRVEKTGIVKV